MKRVAATRARIAYLLPVVVILIGASGTAAATPLISSIPCPGGVQPGGAIYAICMPPAGTWNGGLVVYAHGYVAPGEPITIPEDQLVLPDGTSIPGVVNGLGYAFAVTSYRDNGLVVKDGIDDLVELVGIFEGDYGQAGHVYLVGASEGGLITALATERHPDVFDGGLATCGPVGNFRAQINYWDDVRVLFDYFFPGVIPGSPVQIPARVMKKWETRYEPAIVAALTADPHATEQLLKTALIPVKTSDPAANIQAVVDLLWYNVFATNDGAEKLGGQPFDNSRRIYIGSDNDLRLNRRVQRFTADPVAIAEIETYYQTSGDLTVPVDTLHTLKDPIVPYWQETLYNFKVAANHDLALHTNIPVLSYGHCNFRARQVLLAFGALVFKVTGVQPQDLDSVLSNVGN
jgi:alpha-beta hydrolase superfamily lysophospholipase